MYLLSPWVQPCVNTGQNYMTHKG